ncbi:hypothetical protein [Maribacter sp. 2210JD10-5]|uniref:hypothetical protein n=1 Tax=Maribacter sp. 2210JD10-5 TaxID=3386272 RepID=UPI0039BCA286
MISKQKFLIFNFLILIGTFSLSAQKQHPFMLVSEADFPELRQKSNSEPFAMLKQQAMDGWDDNFEGENWYKMAFILNHNTLLYALDDSKRKRKAYRGKILETIAQWERLYDKLGYGHASTVDASSAFFNSILGLDMVYNDLSTEERQAAEVQLDKIYQWFLKNRLPSGDHNWWVLSRLGILATYNIFIQDAEQAALWSERYRHHLMEISMADDGSWVQSTGYAHARIAGSRMAKSNTIDIIQANGLHDFYDDPQMENFMLWLNSFALTPFESIPRFGETGSTGPHPNGVMVKYIANRYSDKAGAWAAWNFQDTALESLNSINSFVNYCLLPLELPEMEKPESLLMEHTGATLWGADMGSETLQGILYSLKRDNWEPGGFHHASEDVNSIGIQGYGEYLIANPGTNYEPSYPGQTPDGGRWYEAWMQNTVLIGNEERHAIRGEGGGLIDGLTSGDLEFGTTDSRGALGNGMHHRSLIMVHAQENRNHGYFVLADEVTPKYVTDTVKILLQPNTQWKSVKELKKDEVYTAPINGFIQEDSDGSEAVSIFYALPPKKLVRSKAWKAAFDFEDFENDRLVAEYTTDGLGVARGLTVIFPTDKAHGRPDFERITGDNCAGGKVVHGGEHHDLLLMSDGEYPASYKNLTFKGKTTVLQFDGEAVKSALLIQVQDWKQEGQFGFESDHPLSLYLKNEEGLINASKDSKVKFILSYGRSLKLNGESQKSLSQENNMITVSISKGRHRIELR